MKQRSSKPISPDRFESIRRADLDTVAVDGEKVHMSEKDAITPMVPEELTQEQEAVGESEECGPRRALPDPGQPTRAQLEDHRRDHLPYRSWCPWCVMARATGEQHRANKKVREVPVFSFDYMFITKSRRVLTKAELLASIGEEVVVKILAAYDTHSQTVFGHAVQVKGVGEDGYAVDRLIEDIRWLGYSRISLRSDNEPAIVDLLSKTLSDLRIKVAAEGEAKDPVPDQVIEEHSSRYDSSSNGAIENAIRRLAGLLRTHKLCLEDRIGRSIPAHHPLISWMVEFSAWMMNVRVKGEDGITAHHRVRGREYGKRQGSFGEYLMYKVPDQAELKNKEGTLARRWQYALLLGYSTTSPEYWVFDGSRAFLVRSVQQIPLSDRWRVDKLNEMQLHRHACHQARPREVRFQEAAEGRPRPATKTRAFSAMHLRRGDFDPGAGGFGYTEGCPKCNHAMRYGWHAGNVNYNHDATCRARIKEALSRTEKGKARIAEWELRRDQWLAEQVERSDAQAKGESSAEGAQSDAAPPLSEIPERVEFEAAADEAVRLPRSAQDAEGSERPRAQAADARREAAGPNPASQKRDVTPANRRREGHVERSQPDGDSLDRELAGSKRLNPPPGGRAVPQPADARHEMDTYEYPQAGDSDDSDDNPLRTDSEDGTMDDEAVDTPDIGSPQGDVEMSTMLLENDSDIQPLLDVCAPDEALCKEIKHTTKEIMKLVRDLGGDQQAYRRERGKVIKAMVSEMYSQPRVTAALKGLPGIHLIPGFALDLTSCDKDGKAWDFEKEEMRQKARELVDDQKPMFIIGCPPCTAYSSFQNINNLYRDPLVVQRERAVADLHMAFMAEIYKKQADEGRYFIHEHPEQAASWGLASVLEIMSLPGVGTVVGDQCQYGQQTPDTEEPIKKPTKFMSNSDEVLKMLGKRCVGRSGWCSRPAGGKHVVCSGRRARQAAVYPLRLCKAILYGCRNQLREDGRYVVGLVGIQPRMEDGMTDVALDRRVRRLWNIEVEEDVPAMKTHGSNHGEGIIRDDLTGRPLERELVKQARRLELEYFAAKGVWAKRFRDECYKHTGKPPITVRWVDVNKGDDINPNYRSRLVAREIRRRGEDPIFAPTPPLESLRTVLSLAATDIAGAPRHDRRASSDRRTQVSFVDISRAYFCASTDADKPSYVELPDEDPDSRRGMVGLLLKHMYGTRAAALGWHSEYSGTLVEIGFVPGSASACVFAHPERRLVCSVHGDDLTTTGAKVDLDWFKAELEKRYELKESARLGPAATDDKEARVLNRLVRWTPHGLEYEADPRQCEATA